VVQIHCVVFPKNGQRYIKTLWKMGNWQVQIHHTGKSQWVTSLQDKKDGTVYVLDSYSKTFTLTPSFEIQLSAIYGQGKTNLLIKLPEVQQQTNGYDCGVYALANLVEFCYSGTYNTQKTHTLHWEVYEITSNCMSWEGPFLPISTIYIIKHWGYQIIYKENWIYLLLW
jgi:hypothetical protein